MRNIKREPTDWLLRIPSSSVYLHPFLKVRVIFITWCFLHPVISSIRFISLVNLVWGPPLILLCALDQPSRTLLVHRFSLGSEIKVRFTCWVYCPMNVTCSTFNFFCVICSLWILHRLNVYAWRISRLYLFSKRGIRINLLVGFIFRTIPSPLSCS